MRRCALLACLSLLALPSAAAAGQATAFQIDARHSGNLAEPLPPPGGKLWEKALGSTTSTGGTLSYPLIAEGKIFVTARHGTTYGTDLVALDAATGATVWSRSIGGTYYWSNAAYEDGRVFHLNYDGLMQAFRAADGSALWSVQLPGQHSFSSPPTAKGGVVYTGGAGSGGTVYAVDAETGNVLWTQSVMNGDHSSPAVDDTHVYVSYACSQVYALDKSSGALAWHHAGDCSGGGGRTPSLHGGRLYVRMECCTVFEASTGKIVDSFAAGPPPAFSGNTGVFVNGGAVEARDLSTGTTTWRFAGDGTLSSTPVIVGDYVYVAGTSGRIYGLALATGAVVWTDDVGAPVYAPDEHNVSEPTTGLGAGEGLLVVPASDRIVTYALNGSPAAGGGDPPPEGGAPAPDETTEVTLRVRPRLVAVGQRVRLSGRVAGAGPGVAIELQADRFPFEGTFARVKAGTTGGGGAFRLRTRPRRNTRYRVVTPSQPAGVSREVTVWADYPGALTVIAGRRRRALFVGVALDPPRGVRLVGRKIAFYRARRGARRIKRFAVRPVRTLRRGGVGNYAIARGHAPYSRRDHVLVCIREKRDDGFGRWRAIDRRCGERSFRIRRGRVLGLRL